MARRAARSKGRKYKVVLEWVSKWSTWQERNEWLLSGKLVVDRSRAWIEPELYRKLYNRARKGWRGQDPEWNPKVFSRRGIPWGYKSIGDWCLEWELDEPIFSDVVDRALELAQAGRLGKAVRLADGRTRGFVFNKAEFLSVLKEVGYVADNEKSL